MISLIAAMSTNRVIGRDNAIPWNIPADMRRFRELTLGHVVIMGRKTFESLGRPLPGRMNIVMTRQSGYAAAGVSLAASLGDALLLAEGHDEIFICGGGDVYQQALPFAGRIYLTLVDCVVDGDVHFPSLHMQDFIEVFRETIATNPSVDWIMLKRTAPPAADSSR